jgi:hypothetical protein
MAIHLLMDIKKALLAFGGLSLGFAGAALYVYIRDVNSKQDDSLIYQALIDFIRDIENYFKLNNDRSKVPHPSNPSWVKSWRTRTSMSRR